MGLEKHVCLKTMKKGLMEYGVKLHLFKGDEEIGRLLQGSKKGRRRKEKEGRSNARK